MISRLGTQITITLFCKHLSELRAIDSFASRWLLLAKVLSLKSEGHAEEVSEVDLVKWNIFFFLDICFLIFSCLFQEAAEAKVLAFLTGSNGTIQLTGRATRVNFAGRSNTEIDPHYNVLKNRKVSMPLQFDNIENFMMTARATLLKVITLCHSRKYPTIGLTIQQRATWNSCA